MRFNKSAVGDYASHNLSLYYGECPHGCRKKYCYVPRLFGRFDWASGPLRRNPKALKLCKYAQFDDVDCLVVSFSSDPLPFSNNQKRNDKRLSFLLRHLDILEMRGVPTKVLTKNTLIEELAIIRAPFEHVSIGLSITTDSQNHKETEYWEKGLPSIELRLRTLAHLSDKGFATWASMEPILPKTQIQTAISDILDTGVLELWVGKGSYVRRLENAFYWGQVARQVKDLNFPQVHLKKELCNFLNEKTIQTYLY